MAVLLESLKPVAQQFLGDQMWSAELVLRMGAHLAVAVNNYPGLSGQKKSELVVQTILLLLEDAEKADKTGALEQNKTEKHLTTIPWVELKNLVKTTLPTTLDLLVGAARGQFDLKKTVEAGAQCLPFLCAIWKKSASPAPAPSAAKKPELTLLASPLKQVTDAAAAVAAPAAAPAAVAVPAAAIPSTPVQSEAPEPPKVQETLIASPTSPQ